MAQIFQEIMGYSLGESIFDLKGSATCDSFESPQGKEVHTVLVEHGSMQAMGYIKKNIEEEIGVPDDWLFLVEGIEIFREGVKLICDEASYAYLLSQRYNIPARDPIIGPFSNRIKSTCRHL